VVATTFLAVTVLAVGTVVAGAYSRSYQGPSVPADIVPPSVRQAAWPGAGTERVLSHQGAASDGGQLRVVQQGFTRVNESGRSEIWVALILENTSRTAVAVAPEVTVDDLIDTETGDLGVVFPGERAGTVVQLMAGSGTPTLTVQRTLATWVPLAAAARYDGSLRTPAIGAARLTATGVKATPAGTPGQVVFSFSVHNGYTDTVEASAQVIYRDAADAVIGGDGDPYQELYYPPGDSPGSITLPVPASFDPSRAEVYLVVH
jgi:hypothetical protein